MEEMKICKKCGRSLPVANFKMTHWGKHAAVCNECATAARMSNVAKKEANFKELRLSDFTPRELMEELARRGYEGKLTYTHIETIDITNF